MGTKVKKPPAFPLGAVILPVFFAIIGWSVYRSFQDGIAWGWYISIGIAVVGIVAAVFDILVWRVARRSANEADEPDQAVAE